MSILTICFGTCGIRFTHNFYSTIFNDNSTTDPSLTQKLNQEYNNISESNFFESKSNSYLEPRSVLVDIGDPNIGDILKQSKDCHWGFGQNALGFNHIEGSTNNWSYCYYTKGPEMFEDVSSRLRFEINKIDKIEYFLIILSPSGGCAGSACFLLEKLKHDYPKIPFILVFIMPYQSKDAIQNYNTSFTINKLYSLSQCIFFFENSVLHAVCQAGHPEAKVSLEDLNQIGCKQLVSVLQPIENQTFPYFLSLVKSHEKNKFLKLMSSPNYRREYSSYECTPRWEAIINQTIRSLNLSPCVSLGNFVVYRGNTLDSADKLNFIGKLNTLSFSKHSLEENKFLQLFQQRHFMGSKYLSVLSNNSTNVSALNSVVKLAKQAFSHKAFVHHYTQYNTNMDDFKDVFSNVNQIINDYYKLE